MFAKHAPGSLDRGGKIAKTSVWGGSSRGGREGSGSSEFSEEYMQSAPSFPPKIRSFWGFPTDRSGTSWDMKLESSAEQSETQNMDCSKQYRRRAGDEREAGQEPCALQTGVGEVRLLVPPKSIQKPNIIVPRCCSSSRVVLPPLQNNILCSKRTHCEEKN